MNLNDPRINPPAGARPQSEMHDESANYQPSQSGATIWDEYFKAAITGLCGGDAETKSAFFDAAKRRNTEPEEYISELAADLATAALAKRNELFGVKE
jgi:hypothetical protein